MAKLSDKGVVATLKANDTVPLVLENGAIVRIKKEDLANTLVDVMRAVTVEKSGILSADLFKNMFVSHSDFTYDFSDHNLQTGAYGINQDYTGAGINLPSGAPSYGIMIHVRRFIGGNGGAPALQIYISNNGALFKYRVYWLVENPVRVDPVRQSQLTL